MLQAIKELHSEYVGTSPTGKSINSLSPIKIAQETIRAIAKEIGIPDAKKIRVGIYREENISVVSVNASSSRKNGRTYINLSPLYFVDSRHFKDCNQNNCQDILDRALEISGVDSHPMSDFEEMQILLTKKIIEDEEKAKEKLLYTIGHELGHIYYDDNGITKKLVIVTIVITACILTAILEALSLMSFAVLFTSLSSIVTVLMIVASIINIIFGAFFIKETVQSYNHFTEFRADAFAAKHFGNEGGIHYYKLLKKYDPAKTCFTHPSDRARLKALKNLQFTKV